MRMIFSYMKARALLMLRAFPALLAFALCLALCASIALSAFIGANETDDGQMRVRVGIAGSLEDTYIELGMFALKNMDTSRYYVEFVELDLERAKRALSDGELLGYLVIPEGFADAALGAKITIPTPDGVGELTIPEGTQSGTTFSVRGKGLAITVLRPSARARSSS